MREIHVFHVKSKKAWISLIFSGVLHYFGDKGSKSRESTFTLIIVRRSNNATPVLSGAARYYGSNVSSRTCGDVDVGRKEGDDE